MKILAIVPYPELGTLILEAASHYPEMEVSVFHGYYGNAMAYLTAFPKEHFDLIISRGGTAALLMEKVKIPVVEIRVATFDILRVLLQAEHLHSRIAVITYRAIAEQFRTLAEYLQIGISIYPFDTPSMTDSLMKKCKKDGCRVVIGGAMARDSALARGLQFLLLASGRESVEACLSDVKRSFDTHRILSERAALFQALADANEAPVFLLDDSLFLRFANSAAWELMESDEHALERIKDAVPLIGEGKDLHLIKRIGHYYYKISGHRVTVGEELYYAFDLHFRSQEYRPASFAHFSGPEEVENEIRTCPYAALLRKPYENDLASAALAGLPVHIRGEVGTRKDLFARIVHSVCSSSSSFVQISCRSLTPKGWEALLERSSSPLHATGYTIFFEDIDTLPLALQSSLYTYITDTRLTMRHKLISCAHTDLSEEVSRGHFLPGLYTAVCGYTIFMLPLLQRREDIAEFLGLLLPSCNEHFGRTVIGFTQGALSRLTNYSWPLNLTQMETVLRQLVAQSTSVYITEDAVASLTRSAPDSATLTGFDLSGTLEEIEKRIIEKILKEENMNQSAAAKRLGIGRSTLWRKLK